MMPLLNQETSKRWLRCTLTSINLTPVTMEIVVKSQPAASHRQLPARAGYQLSRRESRL